MWPLNDCFVPKDAMRPEDAASSSFDCFNIDQKERDAMTRSAAIPTDEHTLYAALELSKNSWLLAIQFPERDNPSLHPIKGGDADSLVAKLDAARERLAKVVGQVPTVTLCYEAGYDGFWKRGFVGWMVDLALCGKGFGASDAVGLWFGWRGFWSSNQSDGEVILAWDEGFRRCGGRIVTRRFPGHRKPAIFAY